MTKLLIKNGRVIDPANGRDETADILIENGLIAAIHPADSSGAEMMDATGKLVIPGAIDLHVHLRDFEQGYKETIKTGTLAARNGGITTIFAMPNTRPPLDSPAVIRKYMDIIEKNAAVDVFVVPAITKNLGECDLAPLDEYPRLGITMITNDGLDVNNEELLEEAYRKAAELDLVVMTHPEMDNIGQGGVMNEGSVSRKLGVPGQPNEKEWRAVERAIRLALKTNCRAHLTHLSASESVELVRQAKKQTDLITADATPHHFWFTDELVEQLGGQAKVNPPLRTEADRQAIIEGLKDETIDAVATDHAPHSEEEKNTDLLRAAFGFTGLEVLIPATITELYHHQKMELSAVIALLTAKPASLIGLKTGRLDIGLPADLTIIDLDAEKKVDSQTFASKGKTTPFDGLPLKGWPVMTVRRGKVWHAR